MLLIDILFYMLGITVLLFTVIFYYLSDNKKEYGNYLLLLLFLAIVTNKVLLLEEEIILILIVLLVLDATGSSVKEIIWGILEEKTVKIEEKLREYLLKKKNIITILINVYINRQNFEKQLKGVYVYYIDYVLLLILINYSSINIIKYSNNEKFLIENFLTKIVTKDNLAILQEIFYVLQEADSNGNSNNIEELLQEIEESE
jgi:hypothetical protein